MSAPILMAGAATTIALSFVSQMLLLSHLGAGEQSDAYYAATVLPQFLAAVFFDPVVPVVVATLSKSPGHSFWDDAWTIIGINVVAAMAMFGALTIASPIASREFFPQFSSNASTLTTELTRVVILATFVSVVGTSFRCVAHARNSFVWPMAASVTGSAVGLLSMLLMLPGRGVWAGAWSMLARMTVETVLLSGAVRVTPRRLNAAVLQSTASAALPLWGSNLFLRSDLVLDRSLAALTPAGGLSLFSLAQQILSAIGQVTNRGALAPMLPRLSRLWARAEWEQFRSSYHRSLRGLSLGLVACLGTVLFAGGLAASMNLSANWQRIDLNQLWLLSLLLSGLLLGDSTSFLLGSAFIAAGDTRTPSRLHLVSYCVGLLLKIAGFAVAGIYGLAVATSAFYMIRALMLWRALAAIVSAKILLSRAD
jgi:peptidoglycan biosynthesis protein MviN/MurJ (putative lipid II flippase)